MALVYVFSELNMPYDRQAFQYDSHVRVRAFAVFVLAELLLVSCFTCQLLSTVVFLAAADVRGAEIRARLLESL